VWSFVSVATVVSASCPPRHCRTWRRRCFAAKFIILLFSSFCLISSVYSSSITVLPQLTPILQNSAENEDSGARLKISAVRCKLWMLLVFTYYIWMFKVTVHGTDDNITLIRKVHHKHQNTRSRTNTHNKSVKTKCLYEILNNIKFNTHGREVMYYPTKHVKLITLQSIFIKIQMSQIHVTLNTHILSVLQPSHKIWRKV